jgi:hypothetical protein
MVQRAGAVAAVPPPKKCSGPPRRQNFQAPEVPPGKSALVTIGHTPASRDCVLGLNRCSCSSSPFGTGERSRRFDSHLLEKLRSSESSGCLRGPLLEPHARTKNWYTCRQAGERDELTPKSPWVNKVRGELPRKRQPRATPQSTVNGSRGALRYRAEALHEWPPFVGLPLKSQDISLATLKRSCVGEGLDTGPGRTTVY